MIANTSAGYSQLVRFLSIISCEIYRAIVLFIDIIPVGVARELSHIGICRQSIES